LTRFPAIQTSRRCLVFALERSGTLSFTVRKYLNNSIKTTQAHPFLQMTHLSISDGEERLYRFRSPPHKFERKHRRYRFQSNTHKFDRAKWSFERAAN
jgi:hypothetical protein